jgi:two-component system cell cycle response regulator
VVAVATAVHPRRGTAIGEFDLVVVSSMLIQEDGLRLVSQLRSSEATRHTPIVLLADDGDMARIAKGLELGANDYVVKPIDRNELLARVRIQVRRRRFLTRLRENFEKSLSLALTDSLTGLFNRRYLSAHLARLIGRMSVSPRKPVSVLLVDIDHFKRVNDTLGHAAGDDVLKTVARRMANHLRATDTIARYGGEEFVVVLPDSPPELAAMIAERLRRSVATTAVPLSDGSREVAITISLGVASTSDSEDMPGDLLRRADAALYEAKRRGRDQVVTVGIDMPDAFPAASASAAKKSLA